MRPPRLLIAAIAAVLVFGTATAALAQIDDPIPGPIPASDVEVELETVAEGLTTPVWGTHAPDDKRRLFVADQNGKVWALGLDDPVLPDQHLFLDVGVDGLDLIVPLGAFGPGSFDERGLLGFTFHPDYWDNGLVYTYTSEPDTGDADFSTMPDGVNPNHQTVIREWQVTDTRDATATVDPASSRVLMTIDQPQFNHNSGAIEFGPDGYLYIAVGDGGGADDLGVGHDPGGNGQSLAEGNLLGKILRIDPQGTNSANGAYGIPADNPFIGEEGEDEIFAYGLRNAFRMSFDARSGALYASDVGQGDIEEVDIIVAGGNYGWPVKEGTFLFDQEEGEVVAHSPGVPAGMIDPIAEYDHDEGVSITGGFVYTGKDAGELRGDYVFGEWTGRLFHVDGSGGQISELTDPGMRVTGFGQDGRGEVYVLGTQNTAPVGTTGTVQRIVSAG